MEVFTMTLGKLQPVLAVVAGVSILAVPKLLNYIVALYLILVGITGVSHCL